MKDLGKPAFKEWGWRGEGTKQGIREIDKKWSGRWEGRREYDS